MMHQVMVFQTPVREVLSVSLKGRIPRIMLLLGWEDFFKTSQEPATWQRAIWQGISRNLCYLNIIELGKVMNNI